MKRFSIIIAFVLAGCSSSEKTTLINISPPDFIKKELTSACEEPDKADTWMELTEHNHFKCTYGFYEGDRKCYGWYISAYAKCKVKGVGTQILKYDGALSFGNSSLDPKDR